MTEPLPAPATPGRYRVALVCLGNICRSPMAHVVLESALEEAGLDDAVEVVSAGTADYHVGGPMDRRAAATLTAPLIIPSPPKVAPPFTVTGLLLKEPFMSSTPPFTIVGPV